MRRIILASVAGLAARRAGVAVANGFDSKAVKQASATFAATAASNLRTRRARAPTAHIRRPSRRTRARRRAASRRSTAGADRGCELRQHDDRRRHRLGRRPDRHATAAHVVGFQAVLTHGSASASRRGHRPRRDQPAGEPLGRLQRGRRLRQRQDRRRHRGRRRRADHAGRCATPPKPPKPEHVKARGAISAVSPTSITVAGVTCGVPANLQDKVGKLHTR